MSSNEPTPEQIVASINAAMVPYICEHTGMKRIQVEKVLLAWHHFWQSRPKQIEMLWGMMQQDDEE